MQMLQIGMGGFNALYGIGAIGASIGLAVGTEGIGTVIAAFGIVAGAGEFGYGILQLASTLVSYTFCSGGDGAKSEVMAKIDAAKLKYDQAFRSACVNMLNSTDSSNANSAMIVQKNLFISPA
jgi:hypothetical protein